MYNRFMAPMHDHNYIGASSYNSRNRNHKDLSKVPNKCSLGSLTGHTVHHRCKFSHSVSCLSLEVTEGNDI